MISVPTEMHLVWGIDLFLLGSKLLGFGIQILFCRIIGTRIVNEKDCDIVVIDYHFMFRHFPSSLQNNGFLVQWIFIHTIQNGLEHVQVNC